MGKQMVAAVAILVAAIGCSKQEVRNAADDAGAAATKVARKAQDAVDVAVPLGQRDDPAVREKERFDEGWRGLETFRDVSGGKPVGPAAPVVNVTFAPGGKESFDAIAPTAINNAPVVVPLKGDVAGPSVLKTQVHLDRAGFSVGALDGRWGRNSAIALYWYQRTRGVETTDPGALDEKTYRTLAAESGAANAVVEHVLTEDDVKGPFVTIPEDVYEKEKLDCLCYESVAEKVAERFHTTQELLERLNPGVELAQIQAGQALLVPNVRPALTSSRPDIARVVISIRGNTFNAFDANENLVFHAPTTLGSEYDPSPRETTEVKRIAFDPWFHYQPTLFHEVSDSDPEANLAPGANSPVGVVWVALAKPHFGIHGTSDPESIGYTSSHGCVRLTNWDARDVAHRLAPGVKVEFVDTREKG